MKWGGVEAAGVVSMCNQPVPPFMDPSSLLYQFMHTPCDRGPDRPTLCALAPMTAVLYLLQIMCTHVSTVCPVPMLHCRLVGWLRWKLGAIEADRH